MRAKYVLIFILLQAIFSGCTSTSTLTNCDCNRSYNNSSVLFNWGFPYFGFDWRWNNPYSNSWYLYRYPYYRYDGNVRKDSRPNRNVTRTAVPNTTPRRDDRTTIERNRQYYDNVYPPNRNYNQPTPYRRSVPENRVVTPQTQPSRRGSGIRPEY